MFELIGITLFLAALLTLNSVTALAVDALCRISVRWRQTWSNQLHAEILFVARLLPVTISVTLLVLLLVPAYIAHEPRNNAEEISVKLVLLAALSAAGIVIAIWRGLSAWRATRYLRRNWLASAYRISIAGVAVPAYRFDHAFPVIAVVGAFRPRLFIANQVLNVLTEDELAAAIAHEKAHLETRDNLKLGLLRACRHLLGIIPAGRSLDRAWAEAAEIAADELASSKGSNVALDLASALVKIARLVPPGANLRVPAGAFLIDGTDSKGISTRVGKLLQLAVPGSHIGLRFRSGRLALVTISATAFSLLLIAITSTSLLEVVQACTEEFVSILK